VSRAALAAALVVVAGGCAQIFGLDETHDQSGDVDAAVDAPPGVCSPLDFQSCSPGEACDLDPDTHEAKCRPDGSLAPLAPCGVSEECAGGLTCVFGACRSWCLSAADCAIPENDCHLNNYIGQVCDSLCDVRDSGDGGCGMGYHCTPIGMPDGSPGTGAVCVPGPGGTIADHGPCQTADECVAGTVCLSGDGVNYQCLRWCYVSAPGNCTGADTCVPLDDGSGVVVIHGEAMGVCYSGP